MGCIATDTNGHRFVDSMRTPAELQSDQAVATALGRPLDSCLTGRMRVVSAISYAAVAARNPTTYKMLQPEVRQATSRVRKPPLNLKLSYDYTNLDSKVPAGYFQFFAATAITDSGVVFGIVFEDSPEARGFVGKYVNGMVSVIAPGLPLVTSTDGRYVGGQTSEPTGFGQATIYRGNNIELVPKIVGQFDSFVTAINVFGMAIVQTAIDESNPHSILEVYFNGRRAPIALDEFSSFTITGLNNFGVAAGTGFLKSNGRLVAFRYDISSKRSTLLPPTPGETMSGASPARSAISDIGTVVGSVNSVGTTEKVGFWGPSNRFTVVRDTLSIPVGGTTIGQNSIGQIFISGPTTGTTYIYPLKNVEIDVGSLVDTADEGTLAYTVGLNLLGWMIGSTDLGYTYLITPKLGR